MDSKRTGICNVVGESEVCLAEVGRVWVMTSFGSAFPRVSLLAMQCGICHHQATFRHRFKSCFPNEVPEGSHHSLPHCCDSRHTCILPAGIWGSVICLAPPSQLQDRGCARRPPDDCLTSTIILTVGSVVAMFWGCGGRTVMGTQPA